MAKNIDYAKLKALSQQILECIGDDDIGENPSLPSQKDDYEDGGQDPALTFIPDGKDLSEGQTGEGDGEAETEEKKKKKKDSSMSMMAASLASNVKGKSGY